METGPPNRPHTRFPRSGRDVAAAAAIQPLPPALQPAHHSRSMTHILSILSSSARSSVDSLGSMTSLTPLTPKFPFNTLEKYGLSSEDDLQDALAQDLAVLQPVEEQYHRQRKWWLFSMIWAHQIWWILALAGNLPLLLRVPRLDRSSARTSFVAQAALANLMLTVLVRNELLLVGAYWLVSRFPFRRFYAHRMLHSIGGLHVGCAFATFVWIILYVVELGLESNLSSPLHIALFGTALFLPLGVSIMIVFSLRPLRERFHDLWELTHRYVGWFTIADLIAHLAIKAATLPTPTQLFRTSLPYLTIASVLSIFYVWFTVRKRPVTIQANSSVAVVTLPGLPTMRSGTFARVSRNGVEWHAFSVATTDFAKKEYSLVVGRAGDWTNTLVDDVRDRRGPPKLWVRGVQCPGFMYMQRSYKKVVTVCTGAGIAPALPHIEQRTSDVLLIWIAKNHRKTYGEAVWKTVTADLPSNQLILHDTGTAGRPDIGSLIERAAKQHEAEAVFVVSNDPYTRLCASICWRKGLRCYGATRDS